MMNNSMIRVLAALLAKRNSTFLHQVLDLLQFSFDLLRYYIIAPFHISLFVFSYLFLSLPPPPGFCLTLPHLWEGRGALLRAIRFRSADCPCSDCDRAGLAWFGSAGLQQAALRHRNNRNVSKASSAKTVRLSKCLLQKTVSSSPGYKNRLGNVSSSSSHGSCQRKNYLTLGTATVNLATDAAGRGGLSLRWGRSTCYRLGSPLVGLKYLLSVLQPLRLCWSW